MISEPRIAGLVLLGFAGAACAQIKIQVNPELLVPLHRSAPAHNPAPQAPPSPAPALTVLPGSCGTLVGAPLPPPTAAPQPSAASM